MATDNDSPQLGPELDLDEQLDSVDPDAVATAMSEEFQLNDPDDEPGPEQDGDENPEGEQKPEETPAEKPADEMPFEYREGKVRVGSDEYTVDEFREMVSKGQHFTREMQTLRATERELEPIKSLAPFAQFVGNMPEEAFSEFMEAARAIDAKYRLGGQQPGQAAPESPQGNPATPAPAFQMPADLDAPVTLPDGTKIDPNDLSEEGLSMYRMLRLQSAQTAQLAQANAQLAQQVRELNGIVPEVRETLGSVKADREASEAAARIKAEWNVDVDPAALRELVKTTGVSDMEAAWLKANKGAIKERTFQQGHRQGAAPKPKTPSGAGRTFNPAELSADETFARISRGEVPTT